MFIPTFWFVFFTSFLFAVFLVSPDEMPLLGSFNFKVGYTVMYFLFAAFLYFTVFQLLRVDFGKEKVFVSNYLKTFTYNYKDISIIKEHNYGLFRLITIHLKAKGSLGKKLTFIPSYKNYEFFIKSNPELFKNLLEDNPSGGRETSDSISKL